MVWEQPFDSNIDTPLLRLNPCLRGRWCGSSINEAEELLRQGVLILVCVEDGVGDMHKEYYGVF